MSAATETRPTTSATGTPAPAPARARRNPFTQRGFGNLVVTEAKVWSRDIGSVIMGLLFPTIILVGITLMNPSMTEAIDVINHETGEVMADMAHFGQFTVVQLFVPAMLAMAMATPLLTILPATFGAFREKGILRRFSGSPMRPQALIAAHFVLNLCVALVASLLAVVVTHVAWGVAMPNNLGVVLLGFVLGTASMAAVGALIASRASRGAVASGIGSAVYFPMLILAGIWSPGPAMNDTLATIARFSPLGAAAQAMNQGWFESGFPLVQVLVMVGWTAVAGFAAVKLFRWS